MLGERTADGVRVLLKVLAAFLLALLRLPPLLSCVVVRADARVGCALSDRFAARTADASVMLIRSLRAAYLIWGAYRCLVIGCCLSYGMLLMLV